MRPPVVHERQELLREEEHSLKMDVVEAVHVFFGHLVERRVVRSAGVVDEVVEAVNSHAIESLGRFFDEGVEGADFAGVQGQRHRGGTSLAGLRHDGVGLGAVGVISENRANPFSGQAEHGVASEAAAAAGDDGDLWMGRIQD